MICESRQLVFLARTSRWAPSAHATDANKIAQQITRDMALL